MTHPNHQTNGASLEDCHTNFFALTDLCGIRWRKLVWGEGGSSPEPMDDPVLSSFSRCLAVDILCVWRRVAWPAAPGGLLDFLPAAAGHGQPPLSLRAAKELWIFWYGEEPDLSGLVAPELIGGQGEQGSWENGLSYECRSLLFKALHNLIERCLLSRGVTRIGKWFVQPYEGSEKIMGKSIHFSFSFVFFVHGESTVCASIDVRRHPLVRKLSRQHLSEAQASTSETKVLLAPFGLAGVLTGQGYKALDLQTQRLLEDWRHFYPIPGRDVEAEDLPPVVEVVVGGVKMRYPTCYVLVTDMDAPDKQGPPSSPVKARQGLGPPPLPAHLSEFVWQDNCLNPTQHEAGEGDAAASQQPSPGHWEFVDPTRKVNCSCSKYRKAGVTKELPTNKVASGSNSSSGKVLKGDKMEKGSRGCGRGGITPFHHRSPLLEDDSWAVEVAEPISRLVGLSTPSGGSSYPRGQSMTPNPLPTLHGGLNDSLPVPSVGSPASAGPSPLPHSHSQPASVPPADPTMPTLSPHPPASATPMETQDKVTPAATPSDLNGPKSVSSISNQVFSPYPAASSVEAATKPLDSVGGSQGPASAHSAPPPHPPTLPEYPSLKRPVLSSKEYENVLLEEEQPSQLLYDYSTLDAWLNYPVKRLKQSEPSKSPAGSRRDSTNDMHTPGHASSPTSRQTIMKQEVSLKQESGCMMQNDNSHQKNDPYVFDDLAAPAVSMEGFKLKRNNSIKEEDRRNSSTSVLPPFDPIMANGPITKVTSGNLFTNEGLQASYKDLDQIFDNSDDTSSDETLQVATPPDSNNPPGMHEDSAITTVVTVKPPRSSGGNMSNTGTLRQEELSKMFPTPPSMEHNPGASPCGHMSDGPSGESSDMTGSVRVRQDIYSNLGSPQEENIEDWSYVFRPPVFCRMVGSSKYAPLTNLSKDLPPIVLPPNCVYKPSWQYPSTQSHTDKSGPTARHVSSSMPGTNSRPNSVASNHAHQVAMPHPPHPHHPILPHPRAGLSPISPASHFPTSPMALAGTGGLPLHLQQFRGGGPGSVGSARTPPCPPPPAYELPSPATSTASSYLNKNINSVEPEPAPPMARAPEASSLVVNILLADTALNIFRDHNFDSCNMCVCNAGPKVIGNIQGADAAIYLPVSQVQSSVSMPFPPTSPFPGMGVNGPPPPYGIMGSSPAHHRGPVVEEEINCTCGFSAVVNRRHSHRTGLFYEDEVEITGLAEDPTSRRKGSLAAYLLPNGMKNGQENASEAVDALPQNVIDLLREQCVIVQSPTNSLYRASRCFRAGFGPSGIPYSTTINMLDYSDGNEVTFLALEQGRQALLESTMVAMCKVEEMHQRQQMMQHGSKGQDKPCVHMWPYLRAKGPRCSQDIVRVMKNLQPLLQDAIQKKCTTRLWEAPYTVSGPLTWRQFHRLAGRGTDDRCEPQPIPSLMVGHDKDWLCLSPYAIHYWEKLLLEPYSYSRDVAYIVVAPDNDFLLQKVRTFFKELSAVYEVCRLGRHSPITKVLREGILRVGKSTASKHTKEQVDDWFNILGDNPTTNMLKLYAQVCCHHLALHLSQIPMDRSLLDPLEGTQGSRSALDRSLPSPMPPPSTPENQVSDKAPSTPKSDQDGDGSSGRDMLLCGDGNHEDDSQEPPAVVVYLVDPFTIGSDSTDLQRLACLGLLRCFSTVLAGLPDHVRANICVQIISLESIIELGMLRDLHRYNDHIRAQAFSVFSQCRRMLSHTSNVKSLTGFGTAAMTDLFLKTKDEKNRAPYRLYTPPYVLAPVKEKNESSESFGQLGTEHCSVLYVSYCLSEDQHWLLAVATDDRGEIFETAVINIDIPNRSRRKKASARRIGLQKLMDFVLGVMSQSVQPWRLVVGRIGRVGHGELKGWSVLLSRKALLKASKQLKEICSQCSLMYPSGVPCVLSACLVSLEPDTMLRLMSDQFTPDERFSQASLNCQLSTPQDVSCTHILVFPTSATTQSSQTAFQDHQINGPEFGDELFPSLNDDMPEGIEEMPMDLNDIFTWPETGLGGVQSPTGSPRRDSPSQPGSPACGLGGMSDQHSPFPFPCNGTSRSGGSLGVDSQDEVGLLHQQPLALGFYVSTAPTGRMPRWFWASCPHLEDVCPAFLKNALLLHIPAIHQNDDLLQQQSTVAGHPLDSQYTTDVLRYVLEGYNALSWLALDSNTRDRLSCLPVHVQALMQLYHMTSALV